MATTHKTHATLTRLPREIRDEIYRLLFCKSYLVCRTLFSELDYEYEDEKSTAPIYPGSQPADLAILRTSKSINVEASALLYAESTFRYDISFLEYGSIRSSIVPPLEIAERFKNVRFTIDEVAISGMGTLINGMVHICRRTIHNFTGPRALGNKLSIFFQDHEKITNPRAGSYLFIQTLKKVTGFKLVVLEFPVPRPAQRAHSGSSTIRERIIANKVKLFDISLNTLQRELELALGPATRGSRVAVGSKEKVGYLEFRPYENLQSRADR